ncbi:MAG TPA: hypothetical protein VN258_06145 [Mobilitalea sp.]|nr:hypothetical protein [Mobilitalea sp.]
MKINRLSLLNSLFSVMNENSEEDSNYVLAHYFLEHYHELDKLNIYDVSADCFVSRSSVRRFCQTIGYDNFLDLKTEFKEYDDHFSHYMTHANRENYREILTHEINEMIEELDKRMNIAEVDVIADRIYSSPYVVFLTSDSSTAFVKEFQRAMVLHGKIIHLISDAYTDNTLITRLKEKDYLFTISTTGTFAKAALDYISKCNAFKVLATVNRDPIFKQYYDKIYHLSATDRSQEGRSVYGKYGMNYMLDVIYSAYVRRYGNLPPRN